MQHRSRFARKVVVAVDAANYGRRDNVAQYDLQKLLPEVLAEAAEEAGLDRNEWLIQPQGDGELALIPHGQPEPRLIDDFIRELDAVLQRRNYGRVPDTRLRLRVAIGFGIAYEADSGFAGDAVVATARLLASQALRSALTLSADADLVVALSATAFETVANRHTSLSAEHFVRTDVAEKEFRGEAWIRVLSRPANAAGTKPSPAGRTPGHVGADRDTQDADERGTDADRAPSGGKAAGTQHPAASPPASTAPASHQEAEMITNIREISGGMVNVIKCVDPSPLDALRRNLSHNDSVKRTKAAQELALNRYPEAVPALIRQLQEDDGPEPKSWVILALGSAGGDDAIQALTAYRKSPAAQNPFIQSRISEALRTARAGGFGLAQAGRQGGSR